jgi:hypothetical protein
MSLKTRVMALLQNASEKQLEDVMSLLIEQRQDADLERQRVDAVRNYMWREDSQLEQTHPDSATAAYCWNGGATNGY